MYSETYDVYVDNNTSESWGTGWGSGDWQWNYPSYYFFPNTVYKYQLICPKCSTSNWGELDILVHCTGKKCDATLKAVLKKATFEVEVN